MSIKVLGFSVAGANAALELRKVGFEVTIFELLNDLSLREQFRIRDTKGELLDAVDYEMSMRRELKSNGVEISGDDVHDITSSSTGFELRLWSGKSLLLPQPGHVLYAPNGLPEEPAYASLPSFRKALGFGLSSSAGSDAHFFINEQAAVIGDTDFALEQACILAPVAASVQVIRRTDRAEPTPWLFESAEKAGVSFIDDAFPMDLKVSANGSVHALVCEVKGAVVEINARAVFMASDIKLPSRFAKLRIVDSPTTLVFAGICNGFRYNDYQHLANDGRLAALEMKRRYGPSVV